MQNLGTVSATRSGSTIDTCRALLAVLSGTRQTVPFAAILLGGEEGGAAADEGEQLRMVGSNGVDVGRWGAGAALPAGSVEAEAIARVMQEGCPEVLTDLRRRMGGVTAPGPIGPLIADEAMVMPLTVALGTRPIGVMVLGVNPYRPLDEEYGAFLMLIGLQIGSALQDAKAYETERRQVKLLADLDRVKMEFFQNVSHELRTPDVAARAAARSARTVRRAAAGATPACAGRGAGRRSAAADRRCAAGFRSGRRRACTGPPPNTPTSSHVWRYPAGRRRRWSTSPCGRRSSPTCWPARSNSPRPVVSRCISPQRTPRWSSRSPTPGWAFRPTSRVGSSTGSYRSPAGAALGGAGIGLSLVSDLVHAHDGHIQVTCKPGHGTTFTFTIPRVDGPMDAVATTSPGGAGVSPPPAVAEAPRLLLIEDDTDLRMFLTGLIADDGRRVTAVGDAESALPLFGESGAAVDLVLTDAMLPGRTGLELVTALRAHPATARCRSSCSPPVAAPTGRPRAWPRGPTTAS